MEGGELRLNKEILDMDIKAPTEFCKPSVTVVEDKQDKDSSYEVYFVYKEGSFELLYVGCGKKGRHKHVFSGSSQNVMLNVCFVFSIDLRIYVFGCKSKEEARLTPPALAAVSLEARLTLATPHFTATHLLLNLP